MDNHRDRRRVRWTAAGIVVLFASPLLAAPLTYLVAGTPELGTGISLLWGVLSLSFGVHAAGDYLAARPSRERTGQPPEGDEDRSATRRAA